MSSNRINRDGLIALSDGVRAYFAGNGVKATVTPVGWRYRTYQINQGPGGANRVSFIPGKIDPTQPGVPKVLDAGTFSQPRITHSNPRPLAWWHRVVSLSVWAVDTTDTSNDELQMAALSQLLETTFEAMHNAIDPVSGLHVGMADIELVDGVIVAPPLEQSFGREFVGYFTHGGPLFDAVIETTTPQPAILRDPAS